MSLKGMRWAISSSVKPSLGSPISSSPDMIIRATQKKMMSNPVTNMLVG